MIRNWAIKLFALAIIAGTQFGLSDAVGLQTEKAGTSDRSTEESGQEEQQEESSGLATIRGSLILKSDLIKEIDWSEIEGTLGQLVALRQPKLPETWQDMDPPKRQAWLAAFYETEEGKKLQTDNKETLEGRHLQNFRIRSEGKFIVYDVPKGRYDMRIVGQKVVGDKTYVLQAFGQFDVGEVDELDFSDMRLEVLRLVKMGEDAPPIKGKTCDGKPIALSDFRGKHTLLAFGLTANQAFEVTTKALKEAVALPETAGKLNVLTVTVDEDVKQVAAFNQKNGVDWNCLNLSGWDRETLNNYGLKSVPSLWLIDPQGKVVLTGQQFVFELNRTGLNVAKLIDEAIAGRLVIGGEPEAAEGEANKSTDGQSDDKAPARRN